MTPVGDDLQAVDDQHRGDQLEESGRNGEPAVVIMRTRLAHAECSAEKRARDTSFMTTELAAALAVAIGSHSSSPNEGRRPPSSRVHSIVREADKL